MRKKKLGKIEDEERLQFILQLHERQKLTCQELIIAIFFYAIYTKLALNWQIKMGRRSTTR